MFKIISNIKDLVTIISIVATLGLGYWGNVQKQEAARANNNLYAKTIQWEDEKGRLVTETTELRYTTSELKNVVYKDSMELSKAEKNLLRANELIKDLGIKARDVESVNIVALEASKSDMVSIPVYDKDMVLKELKSIHTDHFDIEFEVKPDTILVDAKYRATINTVVSRSRDMETKKSNRRFFAARWVNPRWQYSSKNVSDDKDAQITDAITIEFQRSKGGR